MTELRTPWPKSAACFCEVATVTEEGVKLWTMQSGFAQTYEFRAEDSACCAEFHPAHNHVLAVGFQSGFIRVFDVDKCAERF